MFLKTLGLTTLVIYLFKMGFSIYFSFAIVDANTYHLQASKNYQQLTEVNYNLVEKYSFLTSLEYFQSQPEYKLLLPITQTLDLSK